MARFSSCTNKDGCVLAVLLAPLPFWLFKMEFFYSVEKNYEKIGFDFWGDI